MPQARTPPPAQSSSTSATTPTNNINPALGSPGDAPPPSTAAQALANLQLGHMDSAQVLAILRHLPGVFHKLNEANLKDTAASLQQLGLPGGPDGPPPPLNQTGDESPGFDDTDFDPNGLQDSPTPATPGSRRRRPESGTDEWVRQRKDNHKEVERRRRGNINEGINELARIVPNGAGEKNQAKGAILSRAVAYIGQLKENEARNIEKWTLEKLLMDQAMGDLQAERDNFRKMWEEERGARESLEAEIATLKVEAEMRVTGNDGGDESTRKRARVA